MTQDQRDYKEFNCGFGNCPMRFLIFFISFQLEEFADTPADRNQKNSKR